MHFFALNLQIPMFLFNRFTASDFQKLATVLQNAVAVPVHGETSPFILPSMTEIVLTQLQDSVLQAMHILLKVILIFFSP